MPVLERLWGPDLRMQDSGLGVGVCPDEVPGSRVWTPSVACAGLSLALEIPTLIRQLRAAWRTRRGDPRGPERSEGSSWVEEEQEEVEKVKEIKQVTDDSNTHVEGMVQEDYHSHNPYHNAVHAADVTQAMYCYIKETKLAEQLTPLDVFLGLMAAAAHDVDHPGVNQPFLIKTRHHLASLYQNTSVLERHHWRSTVGMLRESGLLSHLPADMSQDIEQQLGSLILATDINRQNEFLITLREHLDNQDMDLQLATHRHFILQIALKCADVCNPCREWELSRQWSERVCEEFYRQGDLERKFDLEISPLCDQQTDSVPAIQIGFISYIVEPLFEEWQRFTESSMLSQIMMGHLHKNKACWSRLRYVHTLAETKTHPHAEEPEPQGGQEEAEDIP
ncbi:hypothetical protein CCH79_00000047 [Gambusia affinis]|uniref:3',5'-cyclic-AMP phosphodiesterase n=1 Tax=Gambusia affinis TaxID=33528 RepID=A0A315VVL0_GAMAF|nr:hypothetical protein CCH79_00000047 [Gambusia affinis]